MKKPNSLKFVILGGVAALVPSLATAVVIDIGPTGQRVESGALSLPGAPANNNTVNGTNYTTTAIGSGISLSISNLNALGNTVGGVDWRDRGDSTATGSLVQLGEDFIKNNSGIIRLTLTGIAAGTYNAFGYHSDSDNTQSEAIKVLLQTTPGGTTFAQSGTTGSAANANGGINALSTAKVEASKSSFQFVSNGTDPVIIIFDGTAATDTEVPVSGLQFDLVPEPSSALMVLLGAAGLVARRRR